jgi:outer membrane protein, adhesin transport system
MSPKHFAVAAVAAAIALLMQQASAQSVASVKSVVAKALATSPDVAARFHAFRSASDSMDVAKAGRGPRLDMTGDIGQERSTFKNGPRESLDRGGLGLNLTQVLWDGLGTRNEIERVGHERLSRYFELLDASEQTGLEAARALYDVQRYRKLVALADDSVVQHRLAAEKIGSRVKAGVGRGVDLEQATARLALAEANLSTEISNLHDVTARYQRIVGDAPPLDPGALALLDAAVPATPSDALKTAIARNPAISASIESLRAARAAAKTREGLLQPRVEARLRTGVGHNYNSFEGRRTDSAAEIVVNWNLFDGGADRARIRQQASLVSQAMDLRDKACRDARQIAAIAYNDTAKLGDQISLLDRNTQSIERARDAYRQQFDIGQRSLLDLLNAENETYTARRALTNAQFDRAVAYARTHAALNQLNAQLGLARGGQADEAAGWTAGDDGAVRCPAQAIEIAGIDAAALSRRVAQFAQTPTPAPAPAPAPVVAAAATAAPAAAAAMPSRAVSLTDTLAKRVNGWAEAWRSKDFGRYASHYAPGFAGSERSAGVWEAKRRRMLGKPGAIGVSVDQLAAADLGQGLAETRFMQTYTSSNYKDAGTKVLTWKLIDGQWLIVNESNR